MSNFMRTMMAIATSAVATYAVAQATSNTNPNPNQNQQTNQAPQKNAPTDAKSPAATSQPRAPVTNQGQASRAAQQQRAPNSNTNTQPKPKDPNEPTLPNQQIALPNQQTTLRAPARSGIGDRILENSPAYLQNQAAIQQRQTLRERIASRQVLRGPDIGLWFGRPLRTGGLVINDIATAGPIARLGFLEGDRIVSVAGQPIVSEADFMRYVLSGQTNPIPVVVFRDGRNQSIVVDPTVFYEEGLAPSVDPLEQFGIVLDDRFDDRIVVWRVLPASPAFYAGFRPGDVITTASGRSFTTRTQFEQAIAAVPAGEMALQVRRGDRVRDLVVDVPTFQRAVPHVSSRPIEPGNVRDETNNDPQRTDQPLDPAKPSLPGGPRDPRANR